jgi:4-carboxymuconolactone decarboxylase
MALLARGNTPAASRDQCANPRVPARRFALVDTSVRRWYETFGLRFNGKQKGRATTRGSENTGERRMAKAPPSAKRDRIKAFTPALVDYTNDVIYGDLWERKALSKRDRSLITVAALVATYRPEQLVSHLSRAIANGVTQEEITEVITHMAFYAGWPAAMSAAQVAYTVLVEGDKGE